MTMVATVPPRAIRQIGQRQYDRIKGSALDCPKGLRMLAEKKAAERADIIERYLAEPASFDISAELQRGRIDRRAVRQDAKAEALNDDDEVASRIVTIMGDDRRLAKFVRRLSEQADYSDRPIMAEAHAALADWTEAAAENISTDYMDVLPYSPGEDRATAEQLIERFMNSRKLARGETVQVKAKKIRREDVADIVEIFEAAAGFGSQKEVHRYD